MDADGAERPPGEHGEVWIGGPMVARGYWENPAATAASFTAGYWRSGDVGMVDDAGYLYVFDRTKDMINRAGYKVYSAEVESTLSGHPNVLECAVVGRPDPVLGERVHGVVVTHEGRPTTPDELRQYCAERLADYKVPESWTFLSDALPRNPNGKVVKSELRKLVS